MSRRRAHASLCPTPSKGRYGSEAEACEHGQATEQTMQHAGLKPRPFYVYRCACGAYHLTSHYRGQNGARNTRARIE